MSTLSRLRLQIGLLGLVMVGAGVHVPPMYWREPPIQVRTSKQVCVSPCTLTITVLIASHPDNRRLDVAWGSEASPMGGSFSRYLDGDKADGAYTREETLHGAGTWLVVGQVVRVTKGKALAYGAHAVVEVK